MGDHNHPNTLQQFALLAAGTSPNRNKAAGDGLIACSNRCGLALARLPTDTTAGTGNLRQTPWQLPEYLPVVGGQVGVQPMPESLEAGPRRFQEVFEARI